MRNIRNPTDAVDGSIFRRRKRICKNFCHLSACSRSVIIGIILRIDNLIFNGILYVGHIPFFAVCGGETVIAAAIGIVGSCRKRDGLGNRHAVLRSEKRIGLAVDKA